MNDKRLEMEKLMKALKPHSTYEELAEFMATLYSPEELELKKQETQRLIQESRDIKAEK